MKVSELIEILEKEDLEAEVIVDGYEGGFDTLNSVQVGKNVSWNENMKADGKKERGWTGAHEEWYDHKAEDGCKKVTCIYLNYTPSCW